MGIFDVPKTELIEKTAQKLKDVSQISPPLWASYAKTGSHKERPPLRQDWWYIRAAAVLTKIFTIGPIGVSKLRTKFGGKKNSGFRPESVRKSGGNNIRKILQQLEKAGLAKNITKGINKGRVITPQGASLLEKASAEIMKEKGIVLPKKSDVQEVRSETNEAQVEKKRGRKKKEVVVEAE